MTTDISVKKTDFQVEKRDWLLSPHGTEPGTTPSVTLDVSKFVAATHYPNGYVPSGCVLGKVTATGLYGPYDDTASDGRQTATGLLFSSLSIGTGSTKVGGAQLKHGFVDDTKLPFTGVTGALDAAAKTDLKLIDFGA